MPSISNRDKSISIENLSNLPFSVLVEKFHHYNSLNLNEYILLYGTTLILDHNRRLGSKKWDIMESILISTFRYKFKDEDDGSKIIKWQRYCLDELKKKFGNTFRFKKLLGMFHESREEYEKALDIYKRLLKFDPEDLTLRRNIISILLNKDSDLIDDHLKECIMDIDSWKIKAYYLLTNTNNYKYALYCMEEILLHEPQNTNVINTIADLYFCLGNIEKSRQYFCLTINIQRNNLRALWGILQCNCSSKNKYGKKNDKNFNDNESKKLSELVVKNLINIYSNLENSKLENENSSEENNKEIVITPSMVASRLIDYYNNKSKSI